MRIRGFTLLELMVTLAIVALLGTIAYPSYTGHFRHARRQQAELALIDLASQMEAYYSLTGSYRDATLTVLGVAQDVADQHYQLSIETAGDQNYLLAATPQNDQLKDACGVLSTNELGDHLAMGVMNSSCW